ncbi:MAG: peptidase U32 family protein [Bdellovibrionales bacterium]
MLNYLELLAPAGTPAALRAAIDAGADAVYCGVQDCTNARNYPGLNFDLEDMAEGLAYAHDRGRKVFIAINSFPRAGEPEIWQEAVDNAAALGADAVIMADIGLLDYATKNHPELRLHLSVQATAANELAIAFYQENFNIKRVVLPRVLSLDEVAAVTKACGIETEVFCFGSVGTMSEGRCFLSSYITGKSPSSDGVCAPASHVSYQERDGCTKSCLGCMTLNSFGADEPAAYPTPCKGRYLVNGEPLYLFEEPIGWNAATILPQLKEAGVTSLKIEGRQRGKSYVAQVVAAFRQALDALAAGDEVDMASLSALTEGGQQTTGAFEKGWK